MTEGWPAGCATCVVLNPTAGRARARPGLERRLLELPGAVLRRTRGPGDGARLAREAAEIGCELLVAVGGDGTVHEVVNGMHAGRPGPRLGVVPTGTGNDFSRALGIPPEPEAALGLLLEGEVRRVDLVRARIAGRESRVVNAAIGGFGGEIARHVTRARKRRWRGLVYLRAVLEELRSVTEYSVALQLDGEELAAAPGLAVIVANGPWLGGGIPAAPDATVDDGLLDVLAVRGASRAALPGLVARALAGRHLRSPKVTWRRVRRAGVRAVPSMPFNADGQPLGRGDAEFEALPGALRVVAPPL